MNQAHTLSVQLKAIRFEANGIISLELRPVELGVELPEFTAGSHVDLHLANGMIRSYSLSNDQNERHRYVVGVLRDKSSRGGSNYIHDTFKVGMALSISAPRNHFKLNEDAQRSVLVAGGIGVTPILCMYRRLLELGRPVELLYCARTRTETAFLNEIEALGGRVRFRFDDENGNTPPDLKAELGQYTAGDDFYCCGPGVMLDAFEAACEQLGFANVHIERFAAKAAILDSSHDDAHAYEVILNKTGKTLTVEPHQKLVDVLVAANIEVDFSCREGICGSCETRIIEGEALHHDSVLSASEKAKNQTMMVCVSGCKGKRLVLDL